MAVLGYHKREHARENFFAAATCWEFGPSAGLLACGVSRAWLIALVFGLFVAVGVATFVTTSRAEEVGDELRTLDPAALTRARFVSDPLRDPRSYDVGIPAIARR